MVSSRVVAALVALVLLLPASAMARSPRDIYNLSDEFQKLDVLKDDIGKLHKQVNGDIENSQTSAALFVLHDLEYFTQMARLELHNLIEVFVLTDLPAEQARFRQAKDDELRSKLRNVRKDLDRRLGYARLIQRPDVPSDMTDKIDGYVTDLKTSIEQALTLLQAVEEKMDQ